MRKTTQSLFLAIVASAMFLPVFASRREPLRERGVIQVRASGLDSILPTSLDPTSATPATTAQAGTTASETSPSTTAPAATTPSQSSTATPATPASSSPSATSAHSSSQSAAVTPTAVSSVPTIATDSSGQLVTSYVVETPTQSSAAPSPSNPSSNSDDSGLSTGSIVGLSVAGGVAALGIVLFFVWKFTRKRFSDFDDNEAIKWPELNAHGTDVHALPTNSTGRAGFGPENESDVNLVRAPSPGGAYASSIAASSVPEAYGSGDPYAVPPLPHLNPNQPYHDDPGAYGQPAGYYDPYRGPLPNTFADAIPDAHGAEAIPMTQMSRARSPGPQMAYDMQGRASPVPQAAAGYPGMEERSRTPVPGAMGTGRASPSPHSGYPYGQR